MSVMSQVGLAGVSIQISLGLRVRAFAARSSSRRVVVELDASPHGAAKSSSQLRNAQYILRGASAQSPGASDWNTAAAAAWPEANSIAAAAPSSARSAPRPGRRSGLSAREYTRPPG